MKNVPIKFRGRFWLKGLDPSDINVTLDDGDFVYGGYARMKFLFEDDEGDFIINNNGTAFLVYPGSVGQLCGYDADGNEVYEGDKLTPIDTPDNSPKRKGRPKKDKIFIPRLQCDLVLDDYVNVTGDYE